MEYQVEGLCRALHREGLALPMVPVELIAFQCQWTHDLAHGDLAVQDMVYDQVTESSIPELGVCLTSH